MLGVSPIKHSHFSAKGDPESHRWNELRVPEAKGSNPYEPSVPGFTGVKKSACAEAKYLPVIWVFVWEFALFGLF